MVKVLCKAYLKSLGQHATERNFSFRLRIRRLKTVKDALKGIQPISWICESSSRLLLESKLKFYESTPRVIAVPILKLWILLIVDCEDKVHRLCGLRNMHVERRLLSV